MATVSASDAVWKKAEIITPADVPVTRQVEIVDLLNAAQLFHVHVPMTKLEVLAGAVPFTYKVKLKDGREWNQTIKDRTLPLQVTISVTDFWTTAEVSLHRGMRDAALTVFSTHQATKITLEPL